jgi:hypothetical protein
MSKSKKSVFPSFDDRALVIIGAHETFDKASATLSDVVQSQIQGYIDEVFLATGKRDQATCTMLGKMIRESQIVIDACAGFGGMEQRTFTNYAQGAQRALHFNIEWAPRLFQDKERILPWSKKKPSEKAEGTKGSSTDPKKAGKVQTTTDKELIETYRKAIQQARLLHRDTQVGALIDLALEIDAEFKE